MTTHHHPHEVDSRDEDVDSPDHRRQLLPSDGAGRHLPAFGYQNEHKNEKPVRKLVENLANVPHGHKSTAICCVDGEMNKHT